MTAATAAQVWQTMTDLTNHHDVMNFTATIDLHHYQVITPLFPQAALDAYSRYNLGDPAQTGDQEYFNGQRGGGQGDYRSAMTEKIANVVAALDAFPATKRAIISTSNHPLASHDDDREAKCLRTIQFYLSPDRQQLDASVFFRAQAAAIFPKNIHFIGKLAERICQLLATPVRPGTLFYLATFLVKDRS